MDKIQSFITITKKHIALMVVFSLTIGVFAPGLRVQAHNSGTEDFIMNELHDVEREFVIDQTILDFENGNFILHIPQEFLNFEDAIVFEEVYQENVSKSVIIPIENENYGILSNFTILYDVNLNVIGYSELLITESNEGTFEIVKFTDGSLFVEEITDVQYISNEEFEEGLFELQEITSNSRGRNVWCVVGVLGVTGIVGALVISICKIPCATIVLCKSCLRTISGLAGLSLTAINACFR